MVEQHSYGISFFQDEVEFAAILGVDGNIDTDHYQEFEDKVTAAIGEGRDFLILDLEKAPLINSMGVGVIVRAYRDLRDRGGGLVLLNPSPGIRQVLNTLMLEKKLSITASTEDAIRILTEVRNRAQESAEE